MRLVTLCAFVYLLNYLDRSNIGNGKILNQETGDSLLQKTNMNSTHYSIVLTVFGIAYTVFDIPANWIMKRYVRPSHWLSLLMFSWGAITLGFAWVQNSPRSWSYGSSSVSLRLAFSLVTTDGFSTFSPINH